MDTEGAHVDHEAARHGGIALMGTIGSVWLLRPDGTLWDVDDDFGRPLTPLPNELEAEALVWGTRRYAWLAELLPARPSDAVTCVACDGIGQPGNAPVPSPGYRPLCPDCRGLGWRPA
jgi:hypothetical protein